MRVSSSAQSYVAGALLCALRCNSLLVTAMVNTVGINEIYLNKASVSHDTTPNAKILSRFPLHLDLDQRVQHAGILEIAFGSSQHDVAETQFDT